ncbi:unnamed protein product [Spirodela intermedia]|uniref:Uncharacterized protein n=1 Tax=Spirodela intermedia TaxID=51605 RepID=A0A7I8LID5_SPIIN|nr:unnamed protein product [Spirodela intermedia]
MNYCAQLSSSVPPLSLSLSRYLLSGGSLEIEKET